MRFTTSGWHAIERESCNNKLSLTINNYMNVLQKLLGVLQLCGILYTPATVLCKLTKPTVV